MDVNATTHADHLAISPAVFSGFSFAMGQLYFGWAIYDAAVAAALFVWTVCAPYIAAAARAGIKGVPSPGILWFSLVGTVWLLAWPFAAAATLYRCARPPSIFSLALTMALSWALAAGVSWLANRILDAWAGAAPGIEGDLKARGAVHTVMWTAPVLAPWLAGAAALALFYNSVSVSGCY